MTVVDVSTESTPFEYAVQLLAVCVEALETTRGGPIPRAYVSPNAVSLDCSSLIVVPQTLGLAARHGEGRGALAGGHNHAFGRVNQFGFTIIVARECIPVTKSRTNASAPDPVVQQDWAWTLSEDVWAIWTMLPRRMKDDLLFGGRCMELFLDGATALAAQGMIGGWQISIRATIPGLDTEAGS